MPNWLAMSERVSPLWTVYDAAAELALVLVLVGAVV